MPDDTGESDTYSDYEMVSQMVTARVRDAITAYTELNQSVTAGVKLSRTDKVLYQADILAAAWLIEAELEAEKRRDGRRGSAVDTLEQWRKRNWVEQFASADDPMRYDWVGEFVESIRQAAWEMGYLKTGSMADDSGESMDEVEALIEGMTP